MVNECGQFDWHPDPEKDGCLACGCASTRNQTWVRLLLNGNCPKGFW